MTKLVLAPLRIVDFQVEVLCNDWPAISNFIFTFFLFDAGIVAC